MKYFILVTDGAGDYPLVDRGNKTPLQLAKVPVVSDLAHNSIVGRCKTIPDGKEAGSDVGHLSLLGYSPLKFHTGRAPLEAASMGIELGDNDLIFRGNLTTIQSDSSFSDFGEMQMIDHSSGEISTIEGKILYDDLAKHLAKKNILPSMYMQHGVGYRGAFLLRSCDSKINFNIVGAEPPHNIVDKKIKNYLPGFKLNKTNSESDIYLCKKLAEVMAESYGFLKNHPVNLEREKRGDKPANCLWLWGAGMRPALIPYGNGRKIRSAVISAVDLIRGIGILSEMDVIDVPGITGTKDTDFDAKGIFAIKAFEDGHDLVFVHVEAPDECGHQGDIDGKIYSLEKIDEKILKPVVEYLKNSEERYKILVMPDHYTPIELRTHTADSVPFLIYDSANENGYDEERFYTEDSAEKGPLISEGWKIAEVFLRE
ncbi:2,3-bisphosphoglycerate-independent phosphoglycerate mutase [Eubacteriales bacterium KG127]